MGKYKHGKPDEEISFKDFKLRLENSSLPLRQKAYIALLYWSGCRRREPMFIRREDIEEKEGNLFITITVDMIQGKDRKLHPLEDPKPYRRCKHGQAGGPVELSLDKFGVDLIKQAWNKTRRNRKVFPFSPDTGYRAVKKLWPKKTPHHFRYNRITQLRKMLGDQVTVDAIKSFTGIRRDTTIQNYGLKTQADIHKLNKLLT